MSAHRLVASVPVRVALCRGGRGVSLALLICLVVGALLAGCSGGGSGTATAVKSSTKAAPPAPEVGAGSPNPGCPAPSQSTPGATESGLPLRSLCALPPEAAEIWQKIRTGGRLPSPKDGTIFANNERLLPQHERGYYHEYTVPTAGAKDRGAQRLILGENRELYYTADHYESFVVVDSNATGSR
jgi:ribonuclease T1